MKTIHKYILNISGATCLNIPVGAEFLCVQTQHNKPCVWFEVDTNAPVEPITFWCYATGEEQSVLGQYRGTFQLFGGMFVGHAYQV